MSLTPRLDRLDDNLIINGSMNFWQRATGATQTASAVQYLSVDRFFVNRQTGVGGSGALNVAQTTDVPTYAQSGFIFPFSTRIRCNTTNTTPDPNFHTFGHRVEGLVFSAIRNGKARLTFWYKSNKLGNYYLALSNNAGDQRYTMQVPVTQSLVWTKFDKVIDFSASAGTFLTTTGIGLNINLFLLATAEKLTSITLNQWNSFSSGPFLPTDQVNFMDNTANDFFIAGIQMKRVDELNQDISSDFSIAGGSYLTEQALCQRYYWKETDSTFLGSGYFQSSTETRVVVRFPEMMRVAPTCAVGTTGALSIGRAGTSESAGSGPESFASTTKYSTRLTVSSAASGTSGHGTTVQNAGTYFEANAEL